MFINIVITKVFLLSARSVAGLSHVGAHLLRLRFWWEATFIQQFASCDSFIHTPLWRSNGVSGLVRC